MVFFPSIYFIHASWKLHIFTSHLRNCFRKSLLKLMRPSISRSTDRSTASGWGDIRISWCHVWKPSYHIWSLNCIMHLWDDLRVCATFPCCLTIKPEQNTPYWHGTDSSVSPRTLTSWEPFVHHLLCLPRPVSVPLTADLLQGRGAQWVVCQSSEWLIYSRPWSESVEPTQAAPHGLELGPGLLLLLLHLLRQS